MVWLNLALNRLERCEDLRSEQRFAMHNHDVWKEECRSRGDSRCLLQEEEKIRIVEMGGRRRVELSWCFGCVGR